MASVFRRQLGASRRQISTRCHQLIPLGWNQRATRTRTCQRRFPNLVWHTFSIKLDNLGVSCFMGSSRLESGQFWSMFRSLCLQFVPRRCLKRVPFNILCSTGHQEGLIKPIERQMRWSQKPRAVPFTGSQQNHYSYQSGRVASTKLVQPTC
jgi:hypothetical protein